MKQAANSLRKHKKGGTAEPRDVGRPEGSTVEIDLVELEKLCALQCTQADIAGWFNLSLSTIEKRAASSDLHDFDGVKLTFREIMERGYSKGRVSLRRRQMEAADAGNATMLIWLGKQVLGQKDRLEHSTPPGEHLAMGELLAILMAELKDQPEVRYRIAARLHMAEKESAKIQ